MKDVMKCMRKEKSNMQERRNWYDELRERKEVIDNLKQNYSIKQDKRNNTGCSSSDDCSVNYPSNNKHQCSTSETMV